MAVRGGAIAGNTLVIGVGSNRTSQGQSYGSSVVLGRVLTAIPKGEGINI